MKKLVSTLVLLLSASPAFAGGVQASFIGSRLPNARSSHIFRYDGTVDGSGNLIDTSGENLQLYSKSISSWDISVNTSISADLYRNPIDNALDADVVIEEAAGSANYYIGQSGAAVTVGRKYTYSVYAKSINRRWIRIYDAAGGDSAYFDIQNGVVGTQDAGVEGFIQQIKPGWYRCWITKIATTTSYMAILITEADNDLTMTGVAGQQSVALYGAQIVDNTDGFIVGPGIYHATVGTVTKPRLDLAPTGAPPSIASHLQASDGNRLMARSLNETQYYSRAHHACMNIFDSDHTLTFVSYLDSTVVNGNPGLFTHGTDSTCGVWLYGYSGVANNIACEYEKPAARVVVSKQTTHTKNEYHVIQLVRSSNIATMYVNGVAGVPMDVTGYGVDCNNTMLVGAYTGGALPWKGHVLYSSLDNKALSAVELQQDREDIWGILAGHKGRTSW